MKADDMTGNLQKRANMKIYGWYILLGTSLIILSVFCYLAQVLIFHRTEDTFFYMFQDLAFLPIQILLVTLIINEVLSRKERVNMLKKLNMVIGMFFSEVGTPLLKALSQFDHAHEALRQHLVVEGSWSEQQFSDAGHYVRNYGYNADCKRGDLEGLKRFLIGKRGFLLSLLENPNLLEHESFTDLLWAVFHLAEELEFRADLSRLPAADYAHIAADMKRGYELLLSEWLAYMEHLKLKYPYLFSLAVRTNPFNPDASVEVSKPA